MHQNIKRGDIYFADFSPAIGSEQNGGRPCVIIQNNVGNYHSPTVVVAVITSQIKKNNLPTHVALSAENGLSAHSLVLLEHIRTIDKQRLIRFIGSISDKQMQEIDNALAVSVGLHCQEKGRYSL